ncbi:glycosyltransferase family protein [Natrialba sp. INN-245]|uniref:cytidylyltransferase domain-containing protein n=1 Tax=Natrialba sp. INN-245 TaxID=2690967 RepID=UPI0013131413|nr:glycosyltransferase family protein [Natrialba sp. INN-245]MWV40050.1 NTP transferase domain-containing protein [Natrialba sp. INN-245]
MVKTIAVIQARVGSTRLPGKVMYPLDGRPTLERVTQRVNKADSVANVVTATSTTSQDDVIEHCTRNYGGDLVRGSESDVLSRFARAVDRYDPEIVVRITGDCPLIDPEVVDEVVESLRATSTDYATNIMDRTFPRGFDVEAFTTDAFNELYDEATKPHHREHVTPYFREHPNVFKLENISSEQVYDVEWMQDRTDLRLTLDEADDYEVLRRIYESVPYDEILPVRKAVRYVDENGLMEINESVKQKEV